MRSLSTYSIGLILWLSYSATIAQAEDNDVRLRIEALGESAQKERIETARRIQEDADKRARELEKQLAEVKKWTTAQFELGERGVIDKPKAMSQLLVRWQKNHEQEIFRLLQYPDKNRGTIESGRALNSLLERVGPAAAQNLQTRRINPANALPLHESTAHEQIGEEIFNHLTVQSKLLGAKDSRRGNDGPIDVDWPAVLREDRWTGYRGAIEKARTRVLSEMATTDGLSPAADEQLRKAVGSLNAAFVAYRREWGNQPHASGTVGPEYHRIWLGTRHIQKLIASTYFIVDAQSFYQLPQREEYHGGTVEDFLSYMTHNNLEFGAPAKDVDRDAYHQVFNLMVRYYLDQSAMTRLQQQLEEEIDEQKTISRDSIDVALGKTMSAADRTALMIAEMKFIGDLIND
jgi:hypothetical protein